VTDYGNCGKCGKIMKFYSHKLYDTTFNGKVVCDSCRDYLKNLRNQTNMGELNPNRESQQEYLGLDKK